MKYLPSILCALAGALNVPSAFQGHQFNMFVVGWCFAFCIALAIDAGIRK